MNVKHLKFFLKIAEIGSLTQAAAVLCIAQPALSRQIQQLEEELAVTLFRRSERGVALTDAGRLLQARGRGQRSVARGRAPREALGLIRARIDGSHRGNGRRRPQTPQDWA